MKSYIYAFLTCFFLFTCSTVKNIKNTRKSSKESIQSDSFKKDSIVETTKRLSFENNLEYDLDFLARESGDFTQVFSNGDDSKFTIQKKDGKFKIKSKTPELKTTNIKSFQKSSFTRYDSEFVYSETKKLVKKIPFRYWIYLLIIAVVVFRKFVAQIIVSIFPKTSAFRLISVLLGKKT